MASPTPFARRPMVRYGQSSPQRSNSPSTHSGLLYPDGRVHTGGKMHKTAVVPRDHDVINPARTNEPAPIFSASKTFDRNIVSLPFSRKSTNSPQRQEKVTPQDNSPHGRKHVPTFDNGNVVTGENRLQTPTKVRAPKITASTPNDNFIVGVSASRVTESPMRERPRGRVHMDKPPEFEPAPFEKRAYRPNLRKVDTMPKDNIFGATSTTPVRTSSPVVAARRETTPVRSGRRMLTPTRGERSFNIISNQ